MSQPKVGLALCGGGFRCGAHVGVLKTLLRDGVRPALVAGASSGALIAALYAAGIPPAAIQRFMARQRWHPWQWLFASRFGIGNGARFRRFLRDVLGDRRIERLPVKLLVACTDLAGGEPVVIDRGDLVDALCASCALPGLFPPVAASGRLLADGSVLAHLPISALRRAGADVTIGVTIRDLRRPAPRHALGFALRCFEVMCSRISQAEESGADLLIRVSLDRCPQLRFATFATSLRAGEAAARAALPDVRALLRARAEGPIAVAAASDDATGAARVPSTSARPAF